MSVPKDLGSFPFNNPEIATGHQLAMEQEIKGFSENLSARIVKAFNIRVEENRFARRLGNFILSCQSTVQTTHLMFTRFYGGQGNTFDIYAFSQLDQERPNLEDIDGSIKFGYRTDIEPSVGLYVPTHLSIPTQAKPHTYADVLAYFKLLQLSDPNTTVLGVVSFDRE